MAQTESTQNILQFGGLVTNTTPDKIPDRNATDVANIDFSLNGMIQTTRGYEIFGNKITEAGSNLDGYLYKKNFGTLQNIMIRTRDNSSQVKLEWFNPNNKTQSANGQWELLKANLTSGANCGFASANGDGGQKVNKLVIGNAIDNMMLWNGATATVVSGTSNSITVNENILSEGFNSTGKVLINGVEYTYTGVSNSTFTGVTPSAASVVATHGVSQSIDTTTLTEHILTSNTIAFNNLIPATITDSANGFVTAGFTVGQKIAVAGSSNNSGIYTIANVAAGTLTLSTGDFLTNETAGSKITIAAGCPKGNILLTAQRKLFIAGVKDNPSKVYYSQSGNITSFGITSGLGSGGSFDLIEGGGPITLLEAKGKNTVVVHKKDTIIAYTRDNDGTNAIENFDTLTDGFDNGAVNFKAKATLNKTTYFMTGIEGAKSLEQAIEDNILSMKSITDFIIPTISEYDHSTAVMTYYPPKRAILIATNDKNGDRKVISIYVKGSSPNFVYDISIDDLPAADFIVNGRDIYFLSSLDQNCYKMYARNSANGNFLNHHYTTKEYTFDKPGQGKEFDTMYIEGFISEKTKLNITVQYGLYGQDNQKSYTIFWNNNQVVSQAKVSALGSTVLGETSLGSNNEDILDSYIFSFPIHFDVNRTNRYKVRFQTVYDDPDDYDVESYWAITNCSTDNKLFDISLINTQNSNEASGFGVGSQYVGYQIS